jgi:hypothetical protein
MGLSFTRAPTVAKGDKITSAQFNALANAFNDRLKSGIGDGAWRVAMFWFNLWRQVRNPDESGFVFPPQGEWWEIYGLLDPENNPGQWPIAGPGEPEGANIGNPAMQFVYGNPALVGEADRLTDIQLTINGQPPATLTDFWTLGKLQRGVIDPDNNLQNVPAFAVAQSHFQIVTPTYSPHGKAYGGYFPTPIALLEDCGDDESNGEGIQALRFSLPACAPTSQPPAIMARSPLTARAARLSPTPALARRAPCLPRRAMFSEWPGCPLQRWSPLMMVPAAISLTDSRPPIGSKVHIQATAF